MSPRSQNVSRNIGSKMENSTIAEVVTYLKSNKSYIYDRFGVSRLGIFGSYVKDMQAISSDIDIVVEFQRDRKNIHSFLKLKRFLEKELSRRVDLGFEHTLKPIVREKIKDEIIYV